MPKSTVSSRLAPVQYEKVEKLFTREEVTKHNKKEDAYVIIDNLVYDISGFGERHPGGDVIYEVAGQDASLPFRAYHPDYVYKTMLKGRLIGKVNPMENKSNSVPSNLKKKSITKITDPEVAASRKYDLDQIYFDIYEQVEKAGLFQLKPHWQAFKIFYSYALIFLGLLLGFGKLQILLPFLNSSTITVFGQPLSTFLDSVLIRGLLAGILIGLGQHQVAFLSHDSAHCSTFKTWSLEYIQCLLFANATFGVSTLWWKYTHNQHHVVTNEWDKDPDITHVPIFSVSKEQYLHPKGSKLNILQKLILYISPITFVPIVMFIARFSMYWQGIYMLFILQSVPTMPWQKLHLPSKWLFAERFALSMYFVWWFLLLRQLPTWSHFVILVVVSHLMTGALHIQLTLSHYDRPNTYSEDKPNTSWFEQQILSGRNIQGTIINEWLFGGLHYQIEHHLFPRAPRHSHRAIHKLIEQTCKEYEIDYVTGGFFSALFSVLRTISQESRFAFMKPLESGDFSKWSKLELQDMASKKEN